MGARGRRGNRLRLGAPHSKAPPTRAGKRAWLAPVVGVAVIVALSAAASLAQATEFIFIAASLLFSLAEGVVLALVGFSWIWRGTLAAVLVAAGTAAVAAPARWELSLLQYQQPRHEIDLLADLGVSIAWGALAGLAGATFLRSRLATLMHHDRQRFPPQGRGHG